MSRQSIQAGKAVIVIDLADQATFKFSKLVSSMSTKMMQASRSLRDTSLNATAGFILTRLAVRSLVSDFISFEDKILNLTAKMGFFGNKTAEQTAIIADLENHIMYLGRTTAFTSQEVADAAIALAQAGFSADELKASLQGVLDLARGTNYALGESADFVANLVRTFNMFGAEDSLEQRMSKVTNLTSQLVKSTRLGTVEIVDLREAFKYAAGKANDLGINVETVMAYFIQMSESGLKASLAGTSLNTMMSQLSNNLDKIKKKFPQFQIVLDGVGKVNLIETQRQLLKLSENMDFLEKTSFFQEVFNMRGARAFAASMEIDRIQAFEQAIKNAGAESRLAAALMESGAGGATRRFTSALETLRITIVKLYKKEFTGLVNSLAYLVTVIERFIIKYKELTVVLLLSPVIFGTTAVGALTLSFALARVASALKLVAKLGTGLRSLGGFMVGSLTNVGRGMSAVGRPSAKSAAIAAEIKAYEAQKRKVLALQTKIDNAFARASALRSAAAQQRANARIASSVTMKNLIRETLKGQQMHAKISRRRNAFTNFTALRNAISDRLQTRQETNFYKNRQKRFSLHAARMQKNYQFQSNMASIAQKRGFTQQARQYQQAAAKSRAAMMASQAKAARAGGMAKASRTAGMLQGLGVMGRTLAVSGKGVATLAMGFLKLTAAATRFVFSWNFVGMVLNVLLMFGHKIPVVVDAFKALGAGISGAFGELSKIGTYAAPALDLFRLALTSFMEGDTGTGVDALQAGFMGLVNIISNQLMAAWNTFLSHVEYLWIFLQKIFAALKTIFLSIFEGISQTVGVAASPIFNSLADIFSGAGKGGGLENFALQFVKGLDYFITRFFQAAIFLHQQLMEFLAEFQRVIGQIISQIPGTGQSGAAIQRDAQTTKSLAEMRSAMARGVLESERKKRSKEFESIMNLSSVTKANQRKSLAEGYNQNSQAINFGLAQTLEKLFGEHEFNTMYRKMLIARLEREKSAREELGIPASTGAGADWMEQMDRMQQELPKYLQALTGGAMSTRAIYRVDTKTQEQLLQKQLEAQQETNRILSLGGGVP